MALLENQVAVITGSTRGFGLALAQTFIQEGARVVISSRTQSAVDEALLAINHPAQSAGLACDVSHLYEVQALLQFAFTRFGKVDIWVNNAGIAGPYGATLGLSAQSFQSVIQTNITGTYFGSLVALQHFIPTRRGKLINILGQGYKGAVPFQSAYSASKIWIRSFTQSLIVENKGSGVSIFGFNPGMMDTDLLTRINVVEGYEYKLKVFPTVVRILAHPPNLPAREAARLASSHTDGQPGKILSYNSGGYAFKSLFHELFRRWSGKPAPEQIEMNVLPFGKA